MVSAKGVDEGSRGRSCRQSPAAAYFSLSDMSTSLLASVQSLKEDEAVLMQWVVTPAIPARPPIHREARSAEFRLQHLFSSNMASKDEVNDRRQKLEESNLLGVLRVAAYAKTGQRADHLIYKVRAALASTRGPSSRFVKRLVRRKRCRSVSTPRQHLSPFQYSYPFPN